MTADLITPEMVRVAEEAGDRAIDNDDDYMRAALAAAAPMIVRATDRWRPMADAKKDRTPILVKIRDDLSRLKRRDDLDRFAGIQAVMRHPGLADDGFDIGWGFAAPVGCGGFPDEWFVGWKPLALTPETAP